MLEFSTPGRLERRFDTLRKEGRAGLVPFVTGCDPDPETSLELLKGLPDAGADIIEIGVPFSDPMADGPAIQQANLRALKAGGSLTACLDLVRRFRAGDDETPIVLMGYYNPIYAYGGEAFLRDAAAAGVDGLIVVDLPAEEDAELALPAREHGLRLIGFLTPTTSAARLDKALARRAGFAYYITIAGITGTKSADLGAVREAVGALRQEAGLPVAVGFGIRTPEQAADFATFADAVVVGSALVEQLALADGDVETVLDLVRALGAAIRATPRS